MAGYKTSKEKSKDPEWEPDFPRIISGTPFTTQGMTEQEAESIMTPCPAPVPTKTGARDTAPGPIYPSGPWELRTDPDGRSFWFHAEFMRRSKMPCFKRKPDNLEEEQRARNRDRFSSDRRDLQ
jgi:hypothetical protein